MMLDVEPMGQGLNASQIAGYRRDGYVMPLDVMPGGEAIAVRRRIEALEARHASALPVMDYLRGNPHVVLPEIDALMRRPGILDPVEAVLGLDILAWGCSFFIKEARTEAYVSWHQDLTYWGLDDTAEVTAWLALSPVTTENGCMRFVPGSHRKDIVAHRDTFADDNMLSRGQVLAVEVDEAQAVDVLLEPGQMSLHHGHMFHASGPNRSDDRRVGLAIRYISPSMQQTAGARDYASPVRGVDRYSNFIAPPRPTAEFAPEALAFNDRMVADQNGFLYRAVETG